MTELSGVLPQDLRDAAYELTIPSGVDGALQRFIDKAERRILDSVPTLPARLASGALPRQSLADEVEEMVLRVLRNPDGKRSETIDDYSYTLDRAISSGELYVSDSAIRRLAGRSARPRLGTIRLGVPGWRFPA